MNKFKNVHRKRLNSTHATKVSEKQVGKFMCTTIHVKTYNNNNNNNIRIFPYSKIFRTLHHTSNSNKLHTLVYLRYLQEYFNFHTMSECMQQSA